MRSWGRSLKRGLLNSKETNRIETAKRGEGLRQPIVIKGAIHRISGDWGGGGSIKTREKRKIASAGRVKGKS